MIHASLLRRLQACYTTLLQLKKRHPALRNFDAQSSFQLLPSPPQTVLFDRRLGTEAVVVAVNLSDKPAVVALPSTPSEMGWQYQPVLTSASQNVGSMKAGSRVTLPAHGYGAWQQATMK